MTPESEAEVADVVRSATGPLAVRGGATRGAQVDAEPLSLAGVTGITLYEPGALTLVVKSGTPVAEVEAALDAEGQMLPFEPSDYRALMGTDGTPTIGGVVATNASGPRRIMAGACRDSLIGVRFVDGRGEIVKNGGRVMKNVTGYDLVKLMAGARGTLGVLTEVAFKLLPRPQTAATVVFRGLSVAEAVRAMSGGLTSPFQVTGAAHLPKGRDGTPETLLRVEGQEASVAERAEKLRRGLAPIGEAEVRRQTGDSDLGPAGEWHAVRDAAMFAGSAEDVWRISVRPSDAVAVAGRLEGARLLFDWGGGLIWAGVAPGTDLRARLSGLSGHATLVRADDDTRARLGNIHPEPAPLAVMAEGLRRQFDPRGILNPGAMG